MLLTFIYLRLFFPPEPDFSATSTTESSVFTSALTCVSPSVLCPGASKCISGDQLCDGRKDCPDGSDERNCEVQCKNTGISESQGQSMNSSPIAKKKPAPLGLMPSLCTPQMTSCAVTRRHVFQGGKSVMGKFTVLMAQTKRCVDLQLLLLYVSQQEK